MTSQAQFPLFSRVLHWLMAAMIITMLFIGVAMVASLGHYYTLISVHRVLGILILMLVVVRIVNRWLNPPPPLPPMPRIQKIAAQGSHYLLYALMIILPLVGWGMLSAARYPVEMVGSFVLPPILPHDPALYAVLRRLHTVLAYVFFFTVLVHLGAALLHALIIRDGVFASMASWRRARAPVTAGSGHRR